jgi:polyhydroxybutyrate depolymerase
MSNHELIRRTVLAVVTGILLAGALTGCTDPGGGPDCPAGRTQAAGEHTLSVAGVERRYVLDLPPGDGTRAAPLLLPLHGWAATPTDQAARDGFGDKATARGYVVVYPAVAGGTDNWNYFGDAGKPDDDAFLDALITQMQATQCVDAGRV